MKKTLFICACALWLGACTPGKRVTGTVNNPTPAAPVDERDTRKETNIYVQGGGGEGGTGVTNADSARLFDRQKVGRTQDALNSSGANRSIAASEGEDVNYAANTRRKRSVRIPDRVTTAFAALYPNERGGGWNVIRRNYGGNVFQTKFNREGRIYDAFFDENGKWIKTETAVMYEQVPERVINTLDTRDARALRYSQVETPDYPALYRVFVGRNQNEYYTPDGMRVRPQNMVD